MIVGPWIFITLGIGQASRNKNYLLLLLRLFPLLLLLLHPIISSVNVQLPKRKPERSPPPPPTPQPPPPPHQAVSTRRQQQPQARLLPTVTLQDVLLYPVKTQKKPTLTLRTVPFLRLHFSHRLFLLPSIFLSSLGKTHPLIPLSRVSLPLIMKTPPTRTPPHTTFLHVPPQTPFPTQGGVIYQPTTPRALAPKRGCRFRRGSRFRASTEFQWLRCQLSLTSLTSLTPRQSGVKDWATLAPRDPAARQ